MVSCSLAKQRQQLGHGLPLCGGGSISHGLDTLSHNDGCVGNTACCRWQVAVRYVVLGTRQGLVLVLGAVM